MKVYPQEKVRNLALVGHSGSGKSTLARALKAYEFEKKKPHDLDKTSPTYELQWHTLTWDDLKINILDTPGYPDFIGEVISAISVSENIGVVIDATTGVQVETEKYTVLSAEKGKDLFFILTKCDIENAKFYPWLDEIKDKTGITPVPMTIPYREDGKLVGIIDVFEDVLYVYDGEYVRGKRKPLPEGVKKEIEKWHFEVLEDIIELDENLMEKYLSGEEVSKGELLEVLAKGLEEGEIHPLFCVSSYTGAGFDLLLDFFRKELIPPHDEKDSPPAIFVFKTLTDPYVGRINYFKVIQGTLKREDILKNPSKGVQEKFPHLYVVDGEQHFEVPQIEAGDLGMVTKLGATTTGDILLAPSLPDDAVKFDFELPQPLLMVAIKPKDSKDEDKLATGLHRLLEEDPTVKMEIDTEFKQTILYVMGDTQLNYLRDKLKNRFGVEIETGKPKVPYRESIRKPAEGMGKYVKQTGGRGQYGIAYIRIEPLPRGEGYQFENKIFGGAIPSNFIPYVEQGIKKAMESGTLAGYPVVDVKVTLYDGKHHPVDSSNLAFEIAGSLAFKDAQPKASPYLLEPIYELEIRVPEEYVGTVIGDINAKRGRVLGMEPEGRLTVIKAQVPLAELFEYPIELRSLTHGRGSYTMKFSHYEEVPPHIAEKIIQEAQKENA